MYDVIIVDANSIGYASQYAVKLYAGGMQTQAVFGFIKIMRDLRTRYPKGQIICLWDGKAEHRYALLPTYKGDRRADPKAQAEYEAYSKQRPYIQRALEHVGVVQMLSPEHEADDLAGILVNRFTAKPDCKVLLLTGDKDWLQLMRHNVTWQDLRDDRRLIKWSEFFEKTGYQTPFAFLQGKALQGDTSDCISGVGGIGELTAAQILAEHGSIMDFWKKCDSGEYEPKTKALRSLWRGKSPYTKEEWEARFIHVEDETLDEEANAKARKKAFKAHMDAYEGQGRKLFLRNMELMQLLKPRPINKETLEINKGKLDHDGFIELCGELSFVSILKNVSNFLKPFEGK